MKDYKNQILIAAIFILVATPSYFIGHYIGSLETKNAIMRVQLDKQEEILKFKVSMQNTLEAGAPKGGKK